MTVALRDALSRLAERLIAEKGPFIFFGVVKRRRPDARFVVLTPGGHAAAETAARRHGFGAGDVRVQSAPHARVPDVIATADAGIMLSAPAWSNTARCPTKLAEFLACGVPVVVSRGIGDTEALVRDERVGVVVEDLAGPAYERAAAALEALRAEGGLAERCRRAAERSFALGDGVARYEEIYRRLARGSRAPATSEARR